MIAALAAAAVILAPAGERIALSDPSLSVVVPPGWHLARAKRTALVEPAERLVMASTPLGPRSRDRESCGPSAEQRRLGARGALALASLRVEG